MSASTTPCPTQAWIPTAAEVHAIVLEMRPIIDRCVERDSQFLQYALSTS